MSSSGSKGRGAGGRAPASARVAGLVLTPGASAGRDQPALVAIDHAVSASRIAVERVDFPYRLAGRRAPDRPPVLISTVRSAAEDLAGRLGTGTDRVALGGRSMGGRMCSMAVADGFAAAALVLVSYPLHPPGKPDNLRTGHLGDIDVPCLFVSGTKDAFGTPEELARAISVISTPVTHHLIEGGDHGLRRRDDEVAVVVREWLDGLNGSGAGSGPP
jgi:predicted alpha/beta-hydrolase family hydrolase